VSKKRTRLGFYPAPIIGRGFCPDCFSDLGNVDYFNCHEHMFENEEELQKGIKKFKDTTFEFCQKCFPEKLSRRGDKSNENNILA